MGGCMCGGGRGFIFKKGEVGGVWRTGKGGEWKEKRFFGRKIKGQNVYGHLDKDVGLEVFMSQLSKSSGLKFVVSGNQLFVK